MKRLTFVLVAIFIIFLNVSCSENNVAVTSTPIPTHTSSSTPTLTPTSTPKPTRTPVPTPEPVFITLISPFAADCGDGVPRIWSNDTYNAPWYPGCQDDHHGHSDWFAPNGCDVNAYQGEIVAPISGTLEPYYDNGEFIGVHLWFDENLYPEGIIKALQYAGIENPSLEKINNIRVDIGHIVLTSSGHVNIGDPIGEVDPFQNRPGASIQNKISHKVLVDYHGQEYALSATLFPTLASNGIILQPMLDGTSTNWICVAGSAYDCIPEVKDYAPGCKIP